MEVKIPQEILDLQDDIAYENPEGWTTVREEMLESTSRWSVYRSRVISNGQSYYEIYWGRGATETQDEGVESLRIWQVIPVTITTTIYKEV